MKNCKDEDGNGENDGDKKKNEPTPPVQKVFRCSNCPAKSVNKAIIRKHEEIHNRRGNPLYPINCEHCDASFDNPSALKGHQSVHQKGNQVETEPTVQLAGGTSKSTVTMPMAAVKSNANIKSAHSSARSNVDVGQSSSSSGSPMATLRISDSSGSGVGGTKPVHPQENHQQDETEEDDYLEIIEPVNNSGRPRVPRARAATIELVQNAPGPSSAVGPSSISRIVNACAQSNLVLHDIDAVHGKIGKITLQQQEKKNG